MSNIWDDLDYTKDAIIEASAGTGKTYTLQQIVLKLVKDGTPVKDILLVTFTKKAAGELRDRIRKILDENGGVPSDFEEMTIGTIHSFCQDLLKEYAFENGVQMRMNAGDGSEIMQQAAMNVIKSKAFSEKYDRDSKYKELLEKLKCSNNTALFSAFIEKLKTGIQTLVPIEQIDAEFSKSKKQIQKLTANLEVKLNVCVENISENEDIQTYILGNEFKIRSNSTAYAEYKNLCACLTALKNGRDDFDYSPNNNKLNPLNTGKGENKKKLFDVRSELEKLVNPIADALKKLSNLKRQKFDTCFFNIAFQEYERLKAEQSYLTYDDMIQKTAAIIRQEQKKGNSTLLENIRKRYRIALVDEFQDTDGEQWTIFNTLFSCQNNPGGFLLVVGDPKQAIYSFRGADIKTYIKARNEICNAEKGNLSNKKTLDTTYRSTKPLIETFNQLFQNDGWFPQTVTIQEDTKEEISYQDVKYPKTNGKFDNLTDADSDHPLRLLESFPRKRSGELNTDSSNPILFKTFAENAAREILKLKAEGLNKESQVSLKYGDFCFLIRGHKEEPFIKKALAKHSIPFTVYKEGGLYNSLEAESVLALFDFLSEPQKRGNLLALLLTPFFGYTPKQVQEKAESNGIDNEIFQMAEKWQILAERRQWAQLFHQFMTKTEIAKPKKWDFDFDRRWTAFHQIFDELLEQRGKTALSITDFSNTLRGWMQDNAKAGENAALRQKENDDDRVKIMTMHVSKGLEFPVVFIAYGMKKIANKDADLSESDEERRLLYVAVTRAKYRVYLPWTTAEDLCQHGFGLDYSAMLIRNSSGKENKHGFLGKAIRNYLDANPQETVIDNRGKVIRNNDDKDTGPTGETMEKPADCPNLRIPENALLHWDSFTSLTHHGAKQESKVVPEEDAANVSLDRQKEQDEKETISNLDAEKPLPPSALPRGTASGTVFHEIMEDLCNGENGLDFSIANEDFGKITKEGSAFLRYIERIMRKNGLANQQPKETEKDTIHTLAKMVYVALRTEITLGGMSFCLKDIPRENRVAEVKFVISEQTVLGENCSREGAFNGSIDLIVKVNDKYIILDWKTNSLPSFDTKTVETAMDEANYHLQYQLYTIEAEKWLGAGSVAGVAYLFVRGGEYGTAAGLFTQEVNATKRAEYLNALQNVCQ